MNYNETDENLDESGSEKYIDPSQLIMINDNHWTPTDKFILGYANQLGFDIDELSVDLAARMKFNVYNFKAWADNYEYKGPKSFISHTLF